MKHAKPLMFTFRRGLLGSALLGLSGAALAFQATVVNTNITEAEVRAAQDAWGKALIQISDDFASGGLSKAKATAGAVLDAAYGYNMGVVLFKPTLTHGEQTFRTTRAGALAYFVGDDKTYPGDSGFALKGWKKYEYKNAGVFINGDIALTQGHVMLTDKSGKVTTVDKTWAFKKDDKGQLRIVLHHSSLPFQPAK
ncbi:hypothetical protein [Aquariibacter lacus]|nr:hypothetical protein [Piscinibacter lacus]